MTLLRSCSLLVILLLLLSCESDRSGSSVQWAGVHSPPSPPQDQVHLAHENVDRPVEGAELMYEWMPEVGPLESGEAILGEARVSITDRQSDWLMAATSAPPSAPEWLAVPEPHLPVFLMSGLNEAVSPVFMGMISLQQAGSIRGMAYDKDFEAPLPAVSVTLVETGETVVANDQGAYVFPHVPPGEYTLIFSKDGYMRAVKANVVVTSGQLTEADAWLSGDFTELEEFVVQDLQLKGTEAAMLQLRLESPALTNAISAELMSRAGASDAAAALNLVSGATVQDGKYAVLRGLPDRYVNSQINGVRLPTADEDKRAVELDQFPAAVIESIQVSKTFTPDQQGDASGGAVNILLKGIPDETIFQFNIQTSRNSQVHGRDFLTYHGGGVSKWGKDNGGRDQQLDNLGGNWDGAAGVDRGDAPDDYKWSISGGGKIDLAEGVRLGGFTNFFYERDSFFYDKGIDDSYWVTTPGAGLTPESTQGTPSDGDFKTRLFDITRGSQSVKWGGLGTLGVEFGEQHSIGMAYLQTHTTEDTAILAENTRGKEYYFPGYDPHDPTHPGNLPENRFASPYLRTETLQYTERSTELLQFHGHHVIGFDDFGSRDFMLFQQPELDWSVAQSSADLNEPDKRQFGSIWLPEVVNPGFPPFVPPFVSPAIFLPFKPAANFTLGNLQRTWKTIDEQSDQYAINLKLPFEQWSDSKGYFKFGVFRDKVTRQFNQDTFSNFNDNSTFEADWEVYWSSLFPNQEHPITDGPPFVDVDYEGNQRIGAWYSMVDMPLTSYLNVIGGVRFESTRLGIINVPEEHATWFPPGATAPVTLNPGDADVDFQQDDVLPSIGFKITPIEKITFRGNYSETVARQTFKELTPILQQEFLGGDVFIGNPELRMSAVKNYDLRLDYTPVEGSLLSVSWFKKDITNPIEYVQRLTSFIFTTPLNYPTGELSGYEFEVRQELGRAWEGLEGLAIGANATFIDSEVILPEDEAAAFEAPNIMAPMRSRDMTNAPEHLYNFFVTYDLDDTGTQFGLFYTVKGDTLVAGAGESLGNFVPSVYAVEYGTLNFTIAQRLGKHFKFVFQAKNLTDPLIREVYRSEYIPEDVTKTSYKRGIDYSVGLNAEFTF